MAREGVRKMWERERVPIAFDPLKDRTQQSFARDADINVIVGRALKGGEWPPRGAPGQGRPEVKYGDFSEIGDLGDAYRRVDQAELAFSRLPASVRAIADHDPATFAERLEVAEFRDQVDELLGREFGDPEPEPEPEPEPAPEPGPEPAPQPDPAGG